MTLPELAELIDMEYRTAHTWMERGILRPTKATRGTGHPAEFDTQEVFEAFVAAELRGMLMIHGIENVMKELRRMRQWAGRVTVRLAGGSELIVPMDGLRAKLADRIAQQRIFAA